MSSWRTCEVDSDVELVHRAEPNADMKSSGAYQRDDSLWVRKVRARDLWDQVMKSTYDHAEPGILFPRPHEQGQQPLLLRSHRSHQPLRRTTASAVWLLLPGSINLTLFVRHPFSNQAEFDFAAFGEG